MGSSNFNLNQSINRHITGVKNQGSITSSDAAELTAHLFDATSDLKKQGLSEEESFIIACKRLGNEEVLTKEYAKVNTSVSTNKNWAYLFIGFNLLYALPALILIAIHVFYLVVYNQFQDSYLSTLMITSFHLLVIVLVWRIVIQKNRISKFIEKQVSANGLRTVSFSFVLLLMLFTVNIILNKLNIQPTVTYYPIYKFSNSLVEFSFYTAALSIVIGTLSILFNVNKAENLSLRTLFEKPSILFLITLGVILELYAASTRSIRIDNIIWSAFIFGLVYLSASFLISYYNKGGKVNQYLFIFSFFGVIAETSVGIMADIGRGNTFYTLYFVSSMLLCIILGRFLGLSIKNEGAFSK